jgi:hypothetical protein
MSSLGWNSCYDFQDVRCSMDKVVREREMLRVMGRGSGLLGNDWCYVKGQN